MKFLFAWFLFVCFFDSSVASPTGLNSNCRLALNEILSLRFTRASYYIHKESIENPRNLYIPYLENYAGFLTIVLTEDPVEVKKFRTQLDVRLAKFKSSTEQTPLKLCLLAEMCLQNSLVNAKMNEKIKAYYYYYLAQKYVAENSKWYPTFIMNSKITGIVQLINSQLPSFLQYFSSGLVANGTGFDELARYQEGTQNDSLLKFESGLLISAAFYQFHPNPVNSLKSIRKIEASYVSNPLFTILSALIYARNGLSREEFAILDNYRPSSDELPVVFFDFLKGESLLNTEMSGNAYFESFLTTYKGRNFVKAAWFKLGWYYYLKRDRKSYQNCVKNASTLGEAWTDADKQVLIELKDDPFPNVFLLKARIFCDGGLYRNALTILASSNVTKSLKTERNQLEYFYRLGRIYQALGEYEQAKRKYQYVLEQGFDKPYHFAANACLQLGLLSEMEHNFTSAKHYYSICLKISKYGYANSINSKAKAGLKRVGDG